MRADVMHNCPCETQKAARPLRSCRGSTTLAVLLLSLGVGASTAAFTFANGVMPHSAPFVVCETTMGYASDFPGSLALSVPITAGDIGDAGARVLAMILAAGALALLVACTRRAARALAAPRADALIGGAALGALAVAALIGGAFGLPALGLRAVAFGVTVSMVAAHAARAEWKSRLTLASAASE